MAYPNLTAEGHVRTVENHVIPAEHQHLFEHLVFNRRILSLSPPREKLVPFDPDALGDLIASGDRAWMDAVPKLVQERIGELNL